MSNNWIRWTQSDDLSLGLDRGQMPLENVKTTMNKFKDLALKYIDETNADCVIYAKEEYDKNYALEHIRFYTRTARTNEELKNLKAVLRNSNTKLHVVYKEDLI